MFTVTAQTPKPPSRAAIKAALKRERKKAAAEALQAIRKPIITVPQHRKMTDYEELKALLLAGKRAGARAYKPRSEDPVGLKMSLARAWRGAWTEKQWNRLMDLIPWCLCGRPIFPPRVVRLLTCGNRAMTCSPGCVQRLKNRRNFQKMREQMRQREIIAEAIYQAGV